MAIMLEINLTMSFAKWRTWQKKTLQRIWHSDNTTGLAVWLAIEHYLSKNVTKRPHEPMEIFHLQILHIQYYKVTAFKHTYVHVDVYNIQLARTTFKSYNNIWQYFIIVSIVYFFYKYHCGCFTIVMAASVKFVSKQMPICQRC